MDTDVVVIGAGPVGLFSVFQCGMIGLRCHVVDALDAIGGQCTALYPEKPIYDIPACPKISGSDLILRLTEQADAFEPHYHLSDRADRIARSSDTVWTVTTASGRAINCSAIIVAAGAGAFGPNRPPLARVRDFEGKSVFYSVGRRGAFKDKRIVIAGGGDSAVDWALSLSELAAKTTVVHRRDKFRAAPDSEARLKALAAAGKVDLAIPYQLHGLEGSEGYLNTVRLTTPDGEIRDVPADALLCFFGLSTELGPIETWGLHVQQRQLVVDPATCMTSMAGVFAIGDIATYPGKQKLILTGFAEAATAAHAIHPYARPGEALHFEYSTTRGAPGHAARVAP